MRNLASIQRILDLQPIKDADQIEKAKVLGWQCVVKKGEFSVGDLCVYMEIDSLLPDRLEFEFLKPRGMRIKTIRLRGVISQGICFPLSILPFGVQAEEGDDVTELLGVLKYEPPISANLSGEAKGMFPSFIPKTDETRVQVLQELLTECRGLNCYISEKLDGSSATYYVRYGGFGVCSRNLELKETEGNTFWKVARQFDFEEKLLRLGKNIALQGELIGEGIQGNKYKLRGQLVAFFNAYDIDDRRYYDYAEFVDLLDGLGLSSVPIIQTGFCLEPDIDFLLQLSVGKSLLNAQTEREGIVIRPMVEQRCDIGRVSFKAVSPEFLLKYGE